MKDTHMNLWNLAATLALILLPGIAGAQILGSPLISTSVGGVVSGTYGNFRYVSATNLAVTGTWCGLRQVTGYCANATTPNYTGANIACAGTTITGICTYNDDAGAYAHAGANCPSGYTGMIIVANGVNLSPLTCVRN